MTRSSSSFHCLYLTLETRQDKAMFFSFQLHPMQSFVFWLALTPFVHLEDPSSLGHHRTKKRDSSCVYVRLFLDFPRLDLISETQKSNKCRGRILWKGWSLRNTYDKRLCYPRVINGHFKRIAFAQLLVSFSRSHMTTNSAPTLSLRDKISPRIGLSRALNLVSWTYLVS